MENKRRGDFWLRHRRSSGALDLKGEGEEEGVIRDALSPTLPQSLNAATAAAAKKGGGQPGGVPTIHVSVCDSKGNMVFFENFCVFSAGFSCKKATFFSSVFLFPFFGGWVGDVGLLFVYGGFFFLLVVRMFSPCSNCLFTVMPFTVQEGGSLLIPWRTFLFLSRPAACSSFILWERRRGSNRAAPKLHCSYRRRKSGPQPCLEANYLSWHRETLISTARGKGNCCEKNRENGKGGENLDREFSSVIGGQGFCF